MGVIMMFSFIGRRAATIPIFSDSTAPSCMAMWVLSIAYRYLFYFRNAYSSIAEIWTIDFVVIFHKILESVMLAVVL